MKYGRVKRLSVKTTEFDEEGSETTVESERVLTETGDGPDTARMMIEDGLDPAELNLTEQGNPMEPLPAGAVVKTFNPADYRRIDLRD